MYQPKLFDAPEVEYAPEVVIDREGLATYDPYFLDPRAADHAYHALLNGVEWTQEFIKMYGKRIPLPRLTAWYGDADAVYSYSGIVNRPAPWIGELSAMRDRLYTRTLTRFNSVLLNRYRSGSDSLNWHADDEPELGEQPLIASVSLGVTRTFELKHQDGTVVSVPMEHGSLLLMSGQLQKVWVHRVPKEKDVERTRINLTFRVVNARAHKTKPIPMGRK